MPVRRSITFALATLTATGLLTACGTSDPSSDLAAPKGHKDTGVNIGPDQDRIRGKKVPAAADLVPEAIRKRGTLKIGASADASPPLGFYATDDRTRIGSEIDIATLVADTLGLKPQFEEVSWEDVKAGRKPVDIKYFQKDTDYYLALQSGRIDAHLGPSPTAAFHVASAGQSEIVGQLSGAGGDLQGKIAATTKKDSGLVEAYAAAIDHIVQDGSYGKALKRWGLSGEAVEKSEINPPGLPKTKS